MKKKLPHGDIFAVPLPDGTYLHGRVLLDIYGTLKRRMFPHDSPLPGLGQAYLIEMYSAILPTPEYSASPVLIPGAFVESKEVGHAWPIVGKHLVDPRCVEFPETLIGFDHPDGSAAFRCGEIRLLIPLTQKFVEYPTGNDVEYFLPSGESVGRIHSTQHSVFLWPFTCLRVMGRDNEIPSGYKMATLKYSDLRFSPFRKEVYKYLPFRMEQSYFEKQAQLGLHFERLYE